jgi:hypothetical protein
MTIKDGSENFFSEIPASLIPSSAIAGAVGKTTK